MTTTHEIPRTVHHVWTGPPMPAHLAAYVDTWRQLHPSWDHHMWTDLDDWSWMHNHDLWLRAPRIFPRNVGQFRADVARLELLYRFGGVYADTDMECRKPLDDLLAGVGLFAAWEEQDVWVNNAVMGSTAGHPLLAHLIEHLPAAVERRRHGDRPNRVSGPQFLTPHVRRWLAGTIDRPADTPPVVVFPQTAFYPYSWAELDRQGEDFPDAYTIHHWHNRRTNR